MGKLLVFSNAVEGCDDEYNKWYDEVHLKDMLSIPSIRSGNRYRVSEVKALPQSLDHRYMAIYELDGSPQAALEDMAAATPNFQMSDALDPNVLVAFVEDM
jgi:hypothetical protein